MRITRDSEVHEVLLNCVKPTAHSNQGFPFTELNDRIFEILLYQVFKKRIELQDNAILGLFDNVSLMQGVGEKGRDCVLTNLGKNVGLIQCKQINKNLTKPEIIKEVTKFLIHAIIDKSLIHDKNNFTYYIAVSKGLAGTAIELLNDFNTRISAELNLNELIQDVLDSYVAFKKTKYDQIKDELDDLFASVKIKYVLPSDLTQYLFDYDSLIKNFFRVLTVTDNSLLDYIIQTYLAPTLKKLYPENNKEYKDFTFRFKEYLERSLNYYSSSRTLVFGNQQKKIDDFYYPLTLICKKDKLSEDERFFSTVKYEDKFIPQFKKVLIVDNGGMGKSTVMKWLFLSVLKQRKGIPVFIELRRLKNNQSIINEIINELKPLEEDIETEIVSKLIAQGNFVFFFDGYDEISDEDRSSVTTNLQQFISKASNNLFVMTSRPETALNTFSDFQEFNIKKLKPNEAYDLIKKIGENSEKALRLIKKIKEENRSVISEFLQSPLLVSLLYRKFNYRETIPIKLQEFYNEVFEALFQDHDLTKGDSFERPKKTKLSSSDFFRVLRELGFYTMKLDDLEYNSSTFNRFLEEISKRLPNIEFNPCDFMDDIVKAVPIFNREGLTYRWAHKSFQEYFAAEYICRDTKEKQIQILQKMYASKRAEKFKLIFSLCYDIDYKSFRKAILYPTICKFIEHYNSSYNDFNLIVSKENLDERKSLTFDSCYILIFNQKDTVSFPLKIKPNFEMKDILGSEILDLIPPEYMLKSISIGEKVIVVNANGRPPLIDVLIEKNNPLLKKTTRIRSKEDMLNTLDWAIQGIYVLNDSKEYCLNTSENFEKTNKLITEHGKSYHFNFNKCVQFILDYENDQNLENEEYFFDGL